MAKITFQNPGAPTAELEAQTLTPAAQNPSGSGVDLVRENVNAFEDQETKSLLLRILLEIQLMNAILIRAFPNINLSQTELESMGSMLP